MKDKKKLVFTHGIDIDGYGCAILAKLAWGEDVEIIYADNFDLDEKFLKHWKENGLEEYDQIFVTDHCPSFELCNLIDKDEKLKNKIQVFDHHSSRVGSQDQFPWVHIVVEKNGKKKCGTTLFYAYLEKSKQLLGSVPLDEWTELTRLYDTWEWTETETKEANKLNILALAVGRENYIDMLTNNFRETWRDWYGRKENKIVNEYIKVFNEEVKKYVSKIQIVDFAGAKAGYVKILDIFKNDIAEQVRYSALAKEVDFLLMPVEDRESVSLRTVKLGFDVSAVAAQFGGGGHKGAASFPKQNLPKIDLKNKEL